MNLNQEQLEAVKHKSGPLLIIAGAGTGKTKVLTERIAYIVKKKWAKPSQILALTFTEKSASEMQERVDMVLPMNAQAPTISTFHSFADQILKQESIYLGMDSGYQLMSTAQSYIFFRKHLYELPLKEFRPLGNPTKFISSILTHFSRLQDEAVTPEQYLEYANGLDEGEEKDQSLELAHTFKVYTDLKVKESKLDFADLISTVVKLFETRKSILKRYHEKYKYILVDEYQDTNYTQNLMVNMLALGGKPEEVSAKVKSSSNITVVGDDDQAIYKFRGAAISNILQFKQVYADSKSVVLTQNYRSNQTILDVAYRLIKNNDPYRLEVTEKIDKRLVAQSAGSEFDVTMLRTSTSAYEAERIVQEINNLVKPDGLQTQVDKKGQSTFDSDSKVYEYKDIAILARANNHLDEVVQTLRYYGIPYKLGGSRSLYARPEIQRYISYLKVLIDYSDEISMFNLLSMSNWNLLPRDVVEIVRKARFLKISTFECIEKLKSEEILLPISNEGREGVFKLLEIITEGHKKVATGVDVGYILFAFFEKSGIKDLYLEDSEGNYQFEVENTKKYLDMVNKYGKENPDSNIYEYMDYVTFSIEVGESPNVDSDAFQDYDAVNILTIHSSKGLEFPVVFITNMVADRFPSRDRQDVIPIPENLVKTIVTGDEESSHIMEERRLAYVAFTRAKEKLYLTGADFYAQAKRKKKLSSFIYEALEDSQIPTQSLVDPNEGILKMEEPREVLDYKKLGLAPRNVFSYTQLHSYEMCPAQYKYEYVLGLPVAPSSSMTFGSTIHNTLKQIYDIHNAYRTGFEGFNQKPDLENALTLFEKNWSSNGYEDKAHEKIRLESGKELLRLFFEKIYSPDDNIGFLEKDFEYAISDFKIKGRIDRIDIIGEIDGKKVVEIIDYKTGKAKDLKEVKKDWQLLIYAMYIEEVLGMKVAKASYIFVEHGIKVSFEIDMNRKMEVLKNIIEIVDKIRKGDFTLPEGHTCVYCKYREICEDAII